MTYVPQDHLIPMIYEFTISAIVLVLEISIFRRYLERKNNIVKLIFLFGLMLLFAILIAAISRILRYTGLWEISPGVFIELLCFTVIFIGFADYFLLNFVFEVFYEGLESNSNKKYSNIYLIIVFIASIYAISTGIFDVDLNNTIWLVIIGISVVVYVFLIKSARKLIPKLDDPLARNGTRLLEYAGYSIMMVFVFFLLDAAVGGEYSMFYYIAWVFSIISVFLLYTGVIQPTWFKERFSKIHV